MTAATTAPRVADVAVIIPAHRCGPVLDSALASVAGQTVRPAEVVVADDASGDDTPAVARAWADRLPVRVVELTENQGPAGARSAAIAASGATRLALLDADDVWLPDHLETMLDLHDRHGGIVTADALRWIPGEALATSGMGDDLPVPAAPDQRRAILRQNFVFIGTLFDRSLHDAVGGFRAFRGPEDWDLWIRMVRSGAVVRRPSHPTVLYRLGADSVSADDRLVAEERRVVEAAIDESTTEADRTVLRRTLRAIDGKAAMYDAFRLARAGRPLAARRAAIPGLRGPGRVPSRCLALLVAPRAATAARDRRVHDSRWWLRV